MSARILQRLCIVYGKPDSADPVAYLEEVSKLLKGYSDSVQDAAADLVIRTHRFRTFPTPSDIVTACEDVLSTTTGKDHPEHRMFNPYPDWSPEAIRIADGLMNSQIGREAARGGWSLGLHDFCRKTGRLPTQREIPDIRIGSRQFDEAYAKCCSGEAGVCSAALKKLGDSMLERRRTYAEMACAKDGDAA